MAVAGGGCLPRALAVDTEAVQVTWTFEESDFGCVLGADPMPEVRIRSMLQMAGANEDDEVFDRRPCYDPEAMVDGLSNPFSAVTTPLELGAYDISLELWDELGGTLLARSMVGGFVILQTPGDISEPIAIVIEPLLD
jgi:hypothetical protein